MTRSHASVDTEGVGSYLIVDHTASPQGALDPVYLSNPENAKSLSDAKGIIVINSQGHTTNVSLLDQERKNIPESSEAVFAAASFLMKKQGVDNAAFSTELGDLVARRDHEDRIFLDMGRPSVAYCYDDPYGPNYWSHTCEPMNVIARKSQGGRAHIEGGDPYSAVVLFVRELSQEISRLAVRSWSRTSHGKAWERIVLAQIVSKGCIRAYAVDIDNNTVVAPLGAAFAAVAAAKRCGALNRQGAVEFAYGNDQTLHWKTDNGRIYLGASYEMETAVAPVEWNAPDILPFVETKFRPVKYALEAILASDIPEDFGQHMVAATFDDARQQIAEDLEAYASIDVVTAALQYRDLAKDRQDVDKAFAALWVAEAALADRKDPQFLAIVHLELANELLANGQKNSAMFYAFAAAEGANAASLPVVLSEALHVLGTIN